MWKTCTAILILLTSCIYTEEKTRDLEEIEWVFCEEKTLKTDLAEKTNYMSFGLGLPSLITINLGARYQKNHHGVDFYIGGCPPFLAHISLNYLAYPRPLFQSQYYLGAGIKYVFLKSPSHSRLDMIPTYLLFGYEWLSKNGWKKFLQLDAGGIYIKNLLRLRMFPNFQISYGFGF